MPCVERTSERVSSRVNRAKEAFLNDRPSGARRENAVVILEETEHALDNSEESDAIRAELQSLRRDFKLDEAPSDPIDDYKTFRDRLESVRYAGRLATQSFTLQEASTSHRKTSA